MSSHVSVTEWLDPLKEGDHAAAQALWERYFHLLVSRARAALGGTPRRAADEEDVALSAFHSFCAGAARGCFPRLANRDDLWRILLTLTARKAAHQVRDEHRGRRGGGKVRAETDLAAAGNDEAALLAQVIGSEPTPEQAVQVAEEYRRLLDKLGDDELRSIAVWSMEGCTVEEMADKLGKSVRTVARKLVVIRDCWRGEEVPA